MVAELVEQTLVACTTDPRKDPVILSGMALLHFHTGCPFVF